MRAGFSLVEVVVALLLMEVGVIAAAGTLLVAARSLREAEHLERTVMEAEGVLDSLAGVAEPVDGARAYPGGSLEWSIDAAGVVLLGATSHDGTRHLELTTALLSR